MRSKSAFTLIELLVTIMIIGILVTIASFGIRQAQQSARDGRRKADLDNISIALELYRSDCNAYPGSVSFGGTLAGSGSGNCNGTYMSSVPQDPQNPTRTYSYSSSGTTFTICANLEQDPNPAVSTAGCNSCNGTGGCDWKVSRP